MDNNVKELNDNELEKVTGGNFSLHFFDSADEVFFIFPIGAEINVKINFLSKTVKCRVLEHIIFEDPQFHCFEDEYKVLRLDGSNTVMYILRDDVVNPAD